MQTGDGLEDAFEGAEDMDENGVSPNFLDLDSDGDGLLDAYEGRADADGDGAPNFLDLDSDGDGIPDATEGTGDADGDGVPNFLDVDADGDGIPDAVEGTADADGDGSPNFLDVDADGDGLLDSTEGQVDTDGDGSPNFLDVDSDGDGLSDQLETASDFDRDGVPNYLDLDSDADGIPDGTETAADLDGDGKPNFLDRDSDGDGWLDSEEGLTQDYNGVYDYLNPAAPARDDGEEEDEEVCTSRCRGEDPDPPPDPEPRTLDSDGDRISDVEEGNRDSDGDGLQDWEDPDSDGDGILDVKECGRAAPANASAAAPPCRDTDGDGTPDHLDLDSDGDGIPDATEGTGDADGDGVPNFLDLDSDGDGAPDLLEGPDADLDGDQVPDFLDADSQAEGAYDAASRGNLTGARRVEVLGCGDSVANAAFGCTPLASAACAARAARFRGAPGDSFTALCPPGCAAHGAPVYGPADLAGGAGCGVGGAFLDASSICRAAVHAGATLDGVPGLVLLRLRQGAPAYPPCAARGVASYNYSWPRWAEGNVSEPGEECCEYAADGVPCCNKMRHQEWWVPRTPGGGHWIGATAFEFLDANPTVGCTARSTVDQCALNSTCTWKVQCGCVPAGCECGDACCISGACNSSQPEDPPEPCVERCQAPTQGYLVVDLVTPNTTTAPDEAPAELRVVLPLRPSASVVVQVSWAAAELRTAPCPAAAAAGAAVPEANARGAAIRFSRDNWDLPAAVCLAGVPNLPPAAYSALVRTGAASEDDAFDALEGATKVVAVANAFCRPLADWTTHPAPPGAISRTLLRVLENCSAVPFGGSCEVACHNGFETAPGSTAPVTLTCSATTGDWDAAPPNCSSCPADKWSSGTQCNACSHGLGCPPGHYRGQCSASADAACQRCSGPPPHARFTTAGSPATQDNCAFECGAGYFLTAASACAPCTTAPCPVGRFRGACALAADAACEPCTPASKPANSHFSSPGMPFDGDNCLWACDAGFYLDNATRTCVATPLPALLAVPSGSLDEAATGTTASVSLTLSGPPAADVVVSVTADGQVTCSPASVTFTPANWGAAQALTLTVVDDALSEGAHSGGVLFALASADADWNNLPAGPARVDVADNDCPPFEAPENAQQPVCGNTVGDACTVQCSAGHTPAAAVTATCQASLEWSAAPPACNECADGHYRVGRSCRPCTVAACPVGKFRGACGAGADSACRPCSAERRPTNAHWVSPGASEDEHSCGWACDDGYALADGACLPMPLPSIRLTDLVSATAEEPGAAPAGFSLALNTRPTSTVTVCIAPLESQLAVTAPAGGCLVFSVSDWAAPQRVTVRALVDQAHEGPHSGNLSISVAPPLLAEEYTALPERFQSIDIADGNCPPVALRGTAALGACSTERGGLCNVSCAAGFAPASLVTLRCTDANTWSETPPACSACLPGHYRAGAALCERCTASACPSGFYRGACLAAADAPCLPCTPPPANARHIGGGSPAHVDSCPWACAAGYHASGGACVLCVTEPCPAGRYRGACVAPGGAACVNCTAALPVHARFSSGGAPYDADTCEWRCEPGYYRSGAACSSAGNAVVLDDTLTSAVVEGAGSTTFSLRLASSGAAPTAAVNVALTIDAQGTLSTANVAFTALFSPVTVTVRAADDAAYEGQHATRITFAVTSADAGWNGLLVSALTIEIRDNECPPLATPPLGALSGACGHTLGSTCTVTCAARRSPTAPTQTVCGPDNAWSPAPPTCATCAEGFIEDSAGTCQQCVAAACPAGHYRELCSELVPGAHSAAALAALPACAPCTSKPPRASFTGPAPAAGQDMCPWACDAGYLRDGGECRACPTAPCAPGLSRESCPAGAAGNAAGECAACNSSLPANALWLQQEVGGAACPWACESGYELSSGVCSALPDAAVLVSDRRLTTREPLLGQAEPPAPASFRIALSRAPSAWVYVAVGTGRLQLGAPSRGTVVFTPDDWATPREVTLPAVADAVTEGAHAAAVTLTAVSEDESFGELEPIELSVTITEAFCPPFPAASTRRVLACNRSWAGECTVQCLDNFVPPDPVALSCSRASSQAPPPLLY